MMLIGQKIHILGAGIGGLSAALALALRGAQVTVFEQAEVVKEVGAGIQVSPNGYAVLKALGVAEAVEARSPRARSMRLIDGEAGGTVFRMGLEPQDGERPYLFVHRADLIEVLAEAARAAGVQIKLLHHIENVSFQDGQPVVRTAQGAEAHPEILIGADGLHSKVRAALNGEAKPFFTRQVAWRAIVPTQDADPVAKVYMGDRRHLVTYPLRDRNQLNLVAVQETANWADEGWSHEDDPDNLRAAFSGFTPDVRALLNRVQSVYRWGLFRHPVAATWTRGQVAILGDAAHPTLPFMAQGANMALEDAWVLAASLAMGDTVAHGFAHYQAQRVPRVTRVIEAANKNARNYHLPSGPVRFLAHSALRLGTAVAPHMAAKQFDWIYAHDVTKTV
ncbi:FAD-dependent monooxygenase [Halocynthiibacter halioticoli]